MAVQLSNSIVVYEKSREGCGSKSQYRACARIDRLLECNLLVLTADHVTLCQVLFQYPVISLSLSVSNPKAIQYISLSPYMFFLLRKKFHVEMTAFSAL